MYLADVLVRLFGLGRSYWRGRWNIFDLVVVVGTFTTTTAMLLGSQNFAVEQLQKLFLVSIAFKLVQKFNNLNQLFKTALFVLPNFIQVLCLTHLVTQIKSARDIEAILLVAGLVRIFRNHRHGGVRLDQVEHCGDA